MDSTKNNKYDEYKIDKRRSSNDQGSQRQQGFWTNLQRGRTSLVESTRQTGDSDELMAVYMKAVEDGDSVGQIIYGRLIAMT